MISMPTATGITFPDMAQYGRLPKPQAGRRISMDAGYGNPTMAGPGFLMSRGVGRHITMGAGSFARVIGIGGRDQCMCRIALCMPRLMCSLLALDIIRILGLALALSDGCPAARMIISIPGMDAASTAST